MMKMVMVVIVIKWKMMQQRENKGKCHKMKRDLGLYKNTCHEVLRALLGPALGGNLVGESFTVLTRGEQRTWERQLPRLRWKKGSL